MLKTKYALVTGANKGIGRAIAVALAQSGFTIFLHYNTDHAAGLATQKEIQSLGGTANLVTADLTNILEIARLFEEIHHHTNTLDVLVNCAGMIISKPFAEFTTDEVEKQIKLNFLAKVYVTQHAIPLLKKSKFPSIVNIASRMGKEKTYPGVGIYGPAQAATMKFTKTCALELAQFGIRANCVSPGLVRTDMTKKTMTEEQFASAAQSNPRKRIAYPEDIAHAVAFLVSPQSDYINGETIGVNGGSNLN